MVDATLKQIDAWFKEPSQGNDRPKLLSKLAVLELCGWIEAELDRLIRKVGVSCSIEDDWVLKNVIDPNYSFSYLDHMRPMFCRLFGELFARKVEAEMEQRYAGDLERFKSLLGTLSKKRNSFAHTHITGTTVVQITYDAPSWSINQFRLVHKFFMHYEECLDAVAATF